MSYLTPQVSRKLSNDPKLAKNISTILVVAVAPLRDVCLVHCACAIPVSDNAFNALVYCVQKSLNLFILVVLILNNFIIPDASRLNISSGIPITMPSVSMSVSLTNISA